MNETWTGEAIGVQEYGTTVFGNGYYSSIDWEPTSLAESTWSETTLGSQTWTEQ